MDYPEQFDPADMKLDKRKLDFELERNATFLVQYTKTLAEVRKDRDNANAAIKQTRAAEELRFRRMSEASLEQQTGLKKLTEGTIAALVEESDLVKDSIRQASDLQEEFDVYVGIVDGFREKGSDARALVELHKTGYFSIRD